MKSFSIQLYIKEVEQCTFVRELFLTYFRLQYILCNTARNLHTHFHNIRTGGNLSIQINFTRNFFCENFRTNQSSNVKSVAEGIIFNNFTNDCSNLQVNLFIYLLRGMLKKTKGKPRWTSYRNYKNLHRTHNFRVTKNFTIFHHGIATEFCPTNLNHQPRLTRYKLGRFLWRGAWCLPLLALPLAFSDEISSPVESD